MLSSYVSIEKVSIKSGITFLKCLKSCSNPMQTYRQIESLEGRKGLLSDMYLL